MKAKDISLIATVYNESATIQSLLDSIRDQTFLPHEIIIVDAGSSDNTRQIITISKKQQKLPIKLIQKKGNRSVGRNTAINHAKGDIVVCTDAGVILDKKWVENITITFSDPTVDVVAGYYKGLAKNVFQKCLIPYVLVMPDQVNQETFLPATRSIAFRKFIWEKIGGFDEDLAHNEDYAFARKLKKTGARIVFSRNAIVYWRPRNTFKEAYIMFLRFAYGDAEAKILRLKVIYIFARYTLGVFIIIYAIIVQSLLIILLLVSALFIYILWAIYKNYRYVRKWRAIYILPFLQFTSDYAVMLGTLLGSLKIWDIQKRQ